MLTIQESNRSSPAFVLLNLGLRPFFLLAGIYALIPVLVWGGSYVYGWSIPAFPFSPVNWHAHEMVFGYGMAVVAGFLLTAVRNWTNLPTAQGTSLAVMASLWLLARISAWVFPTTALPMLAFDIAFDSLLIFAITRPIWKTKQKQQIGIVSKVVLLMLANLLCYLGAINIVTQGITWGLYSGVYLLLALMFNMARRVLPFFIERGVGYPVQLKNHSWVDRSSLTVFLLFWVVAVFWQDTLATSLLAAALFVIHVVRLIGWHTHGIWQKPLLWILYVGYSCAIFGFLLIAVTPVFDLSPFIALHAIAVGGIGMLTIGMMSRISLAHTGRNIQQHSSLLTPVFLLIIFAFVARVLLPLFFPIHYVVWIGIAQAAWLIAFAIFVWLYAPILYRPRVDGQPG